MVCPEGLNGKLEALQFTFQELPLWDVATADKSAWGPQLIEIGLSTQPNSMTTAIQASPTASIPIPSPAIPVKHVCDIAMVINQQWLGALEWLQWASPTSLTPVSQHSMLRREPPSVALGAPPPSGVIEDSLEPNGKEPTDPTQMASPTQASQQAVTPENYPASPTLVTHCPCQLCQKHWRQPASPPFHILRLPPRSDQFTCQMRSLDCKGRWMQP